MRNLIKRIQNIFLNKNDENVEVLCSNLDSELNSYCSLEYSNKKKESI